MSLERIAAIVVSVLVAGSIVLGLLAVESPDSERKKRADTRRVNDVKALNWAIDKYWFERGDWPGTQDDLVKQGMLARLPIDPVTNLRYEFEIKADGSYRLCGIFDLSRTGPAAWKWQHGQGRHCYVLRPSERDDWSYDRPHVYLN